MNICQYSIKVEIKKKKRIQPTFLRPNLHKCILFNLVVKHLCLGYENENNLKTNRTGVLHLFPLSSGYERRILITIYHAV